MAAKPKKPTPDFPLFPHASGQWAKKIKGRTRYFGTWDEPEAARKRYLDEKDDLHAGREPRRPGAVTVRDVCNAVIDSKRIQAESGEVEFRTVHQLTQECKRMAAFFGAETPVDDLGSSDFEKYRAHLMSKFGPSRVSFGVGRVRQAFKYAFETELIERMPKFGPLFKGPTLKAKRLHRQSKPPKLWEADQLRTIISLSPKDFKPLILLAINCGFGPTDLSQLPKRLVDINSGWIRYPRPKTGVQRTCPLWPETVAALQEFTGNGEHPSEFMFTTRGGLPLVKFYPKSGANRDSIAPRWQRLLKRLSLPHLGFYSIRHTFQTVAEGCRDFPAIRHIMGHADDANDMSSVYRESIGEDRLVAVTECVRYWLWPETAARQS